MMAKVSEHEKSEIEKSGAMIAGLEKLLSDRVIMKMNIENEISAIAARLSTARMERAGKIHIIATMRGLEGEAFSYDPQTNEIKAQ